MHKAICIISFLFLLIIPSGIAITTTATMEVENSPPVIGLIQASLDSNEITARVRVSDANGYQDIQDVEISIVYIDNGEKVYERFGEGYRKAGLESGSGASALYAFSFTMADEDNEGIYRVKIRAKDSGSTAESSADYKFPEETATPAGAFLAVQEAGGSIADFFRNIFSSIAGWFR